MREPTLQEKSIQFIEESKEKFIKDIEKLPLTKNDNVDSTFYNKRAFQDMLANPKNSIETVWKTRILFQSSPRGNIIMFYDPYKLGFSYYCDQTVSYDILNTIAMRYVKRFSCYDFFLDECITTNPSPLLKLLEEEKEEKGENGKDKKQELKSILKKAPLAKFKSYNKADSKVKDETEKKENGKKGEQELIKERNRFMNLGRITNFSFLQKIEKKRNNEFTRGTDNFGLFGEQVLSYRDFKAMKKGV